ncbi:hypothetical protein MD484_g2721, partial [Candolleomyces efflorescens]
MDVELLSTLLRNARVVSYFNVVSAVILVYDILITLDEESMSIWSGKMTWSKILYLVTRYSTLIEVGVVLWEQIVPGTWYRGCKISFDINVFDPSPLAMFKGCYVTDASSILFVAWLILLVYDTLNLILIGIPAYKSCKCHSLSFSLPVLGILILPPDRLGGNSQFVRTVYTDGIVYYVYLFGISALNIIVVLVLPRDLATLLSMPERVLHAAFTCRVVLHIRALTRQEQLSTEASSIQFKSEAKAKSKEIKSESTYMSGLTMDKTTAEPAPSGSGSGRAEV